MHLQSRMEADTCIVSVDEPRIDAASAIAFKDGMRSVTEDAGPRVVLDLSRVEFIDSSGLGAIVSVMKYLAPRSRLELSGVTGTVEKVFRLTRMDSVFVIHPNVEAAIERQGG